MCLTAKVADECVGSRLQLPTGSPVAFRVVSLTEMGRLLRIRWLVQAVGRCADQGVSDVASDQPPHTILGV
jgi:hypothetical protein